MAFVLTNGTLERCIGGGTRVGRGVRVRLTLAVVFHVFLVSVFATSTGLVGVARVARTGFVSDFVVRVGKTVARAGGVPAV